MPGPANFGPKGEIKFSEINEQSRQGTTAWPFEPLVSLVCTPNHIRVCIAISDCLIFANAKHDYGRRARGLTEM